MHAGLSDTCLDIGGPILGFEVAASSLAQWYVINPDVSAPSNATNVYGSDRAIPLMGDGCMLPFRDKSFDFVISCAILEHVPPTKREHFAQECRQVARKGLFVTPPNFWFPLEPPYGMPGFQFIPETIKRALTNCIRIGWEDRQTASASPCPPREMRRLFPGARVQGMGFTLVAETLIAYQRFPADQRDQG